LTARGRLCFVAYRGNMQCGGQGIYLWFLTRELARQGFDVDVVVGPPYPDEMPFARSVTRLPNQSHWARWFTRDYAGMLPEGRPLAAFGPLNFYELAASRLGFLPEPFAFSWRAFRELSARIRRGEVWDLVHDVQCLGYGLLGLRALGLPVVSTVHHPLTVDRRASFVRDNTLTDAIGSMQFYPIGMQALVARNIDRVLTSSQVSAGAIVDDFGVPAERVTNVWNGLDTDLYSPDPSAARNPRELLCVGRSSDPNKGIRTLVEALSRLPQDVTLTLVDDDHPDNSARKWAREAGVADRLHIAGRVPTDELVRLYRRASLVVVPSRYEGFGLPAVEAMACGTPVVACAAGALPEVLTLTGGGRLVPRDDAPAMAREIGALLEAPERLAELSRHAREQVVATLSWPRIAEATAAVYAEVLEERRGRPTRMATSASSGARRAIPSSAPRHRLATDSGSRLTQPDQPGMPHSSETPSTNSSSSEREACSRINANS
jgi:glycosyltransferase involved in cell wall biosynthesis